MSQEEQTTESVKTGKRPKIVYCGYSLSNIAAKVRTGDFSSQILYGALELEQKGAEVSFYSQAGSLKGALQDIRQLHRMRADFLFFPYLKGTFYLLLALAKRMGYLRHERLAGILHFTPTITSSNRWYIRWVYKVFDKVYFHSPRNMEECIQRGVVRQDQAELLHWGTQLSYIDRIVAEQEEPTADEDFFISTGLENRDYDTLIEGFERSGQRLEIYAYTGCGLQERDTEHVKIHLIPRQNSTQTFTALRTLKAKAVVIPINAKGLAYCTGHTSIVEALALGKPIIVTDNPYHPIDVEKVGVGLKVNPNDPQAWAEAVDSFSASEERSSEFARNARRLAETTYNIDKCADQIAAYMTHTFGEW